MNSASSAINFRMHIRGGNFCCHRWRCDIRSRNDNETFPFLITDGDGLRIISCFVIIFGRLRHTNSGMHTFYLESTQLR